MLSVNQVWLVLIDYGFTVFHSALILFNLFAWVWRPLQKWHLLSILLTFASWVILGIWYGWGYCPLTDWHWEVLRLRGIGDVPISYVGYLIQRLTGLSLPEKWVESGTLVLALWALAMSLWVNFKHRDGKGSYRK